MSDNELLHVLKTAREEAKHFMIGGDTDVALVAALVNYQAARQITEKLDLIHTRLSDLNNNFWRSLSQ